MKKCFLGGTCNESKWRENLIKILKIDYFNPVVDDWTPDCMAEEIRQRKLCDYCLYVITPKMTGVYSIAEVVDDSNKKPKQTVFCILEKDEDKIFDKGQLKSLDSVGEMVRRNGGKYFKQLEEIANFLNKNTETFQEIQTLDQHKQMYIDKNLWEDIKYRSDILENVDIPSIELPKLRNILEKFQILADQKDGM